MNNKDINKVILTKKELLDRTNNDMVASRCYLVHFKVYINDTQFYRMKLVYTIEDYEVLEYYDKDSYTKDELNEVVNELSQLSLLSNNSIKEMVEYCNDTIHKYNKYARA